MDRVSHHGRDTAFRVRARDDGLTLLCVHGSGGSNRVWKSQERLPLSVVSIDLSGHGESDDVNADPGYETLSAYAADVEAVARATDATVLVGSSLGGAVALTVALERDLPLDGLVLSGTGARLPVLDDLLQWLDDDFDRAVDFLHAPDRLFHQPSDALVATSRAEMLDVGRAVTRRDFRTCHRFDVRDRLGDVSVPALALVGEHDQLTPPSYHESLSAELPVCDMAVIEDAAHLPMLERPRVFNRAVETFLDSLS